MIQSDYDCLFLIEYFTDSALILRTSDNKTLELDVIGQEILILFLANQDVHSIAATMSDRYEIDLDQAETDVVKLLKHLELFGLSQQVIELNEPVILARNCNGILSMSL